MDVAIPLALKWDVAISLSLKLDVAISLALKLDLEILLAVAGPEYNNPWDKSILNRIGLEVSMPGYTYSMDSGPIWISD